MRLFISLVLTASLAAASAWAQEIPRFKGRILSFDGKILSVSAGKAGETLSIGLMPTTRVMHEEKADSLAIKPGDYLGATLAKSGGEWRAQEAHVMPPMLRGQGEGLYPLPSDAEERIVTGEVTANDPQSGLVTIAFRGSVGADGPTCTGRAPREGGCKGEIRFGLSAKTRVVALKPADKTALAPGKVAAISVIAGPDGHLVTPGLIVEDEPPDSVPSSP